MALEKPSSGLPDLAWALSKGEAGVCVLYSGYSGSHIVDTFLFH